MSHAIVQMYYAGKVSIVYLKIKFHCVSCILSGNPRERGFSSSNSNSCLSLSGAVRPLFPNWKEKTNKLVLARTKPAPPERDRGPCLSRGKGALTGASWEQLCQMTEGLEKVS